MSKILTYRELRLKLEKLEDKLSQPPYYHHFGVDAYGTFDIKDSTSLTPEEALRLGKWLVEFYAGVNSGWEEDE